MGVSPFQLVNLHRNQRYFVIRLHTWFCLSYFLKTSINCIAFINILWVSTVFSTPYLFLDTAVRLQWPVTQISTFHQFFLINVKKNEKLNGLNKDLLVLRQRTSAHREYCHNMIKFAEDLSGSFSFFPFYCSFITM